MPPGGGLLTPAQAAERLAMSVGELSVLWLEKRGPQNVYLGPHVMFRVGDIAHFAETRRESTQPVNVVSTRQSLPPLWLRAVEELGSLRAAYDSAKASPRRNAFYSYLGDISLAVRANLDDGPPEHRFAQFAALSNELIKRSSDFSKASRSRYARALAFCDADKIWGRHIQEHIGGDLKKFVDAQESKKRRAKVPRPHVPRERKAAKLGGSGDVLPFDHCPSPRRKSRPRSTA